MERQVFVALADPTRRRILQTLRKGPRSVGELVAAVGAHQPAVSRHLRVLQDAGLVKVRAEAQRRIYALRPQPFRDLDAWLGDFRTLWTERLDNLAEYAWTKTRGATKGRGR